VEAYTDGGYELIDLPSADPGTRLQFVLDRTGQIPRGGR
jgi:predicted ATPase